MDSQEMCKYCQTIGCRKDNWGLPSRKCVPPITRHDKRVIQLVEEMHDTSFQQPVVVLHGILSAFLRMDLNPPHVLPDVDHVGAPYAFYLYQAIGADKVGLVPTELLQTAFCRLVVFRTALYFSSKVDALPKRLNHRRIDYLDCPILNDFLDSFSDLVIDCKDVDFYRTEVHLLHTMLALHHDSNEWIKDELGLLPAFNHYEFEAYSNTRSFRQGKVMDVFYAVKRMVREIGTPTLLSPLHSTGTSIPNENHVRIFALFLYSHSI